MSVRKRVVAVLLAILAVVVVGAPARAEVTATTQPLAELKSVIWPHSPVASQPPLVWPWTKVDVCWENLSDSTAQQRGWVDDAVRDTWEAAAYYLKIDFHGECTTNSKGVRILVADARPNTRGFGSNLDGVENGMRLNFTFLNFATGCNNVASRQGCIEDNAVHEFGHALGFTHEQNRSDSTCEGMNQSSDPDRALTIYDPESVMNYCTAWRNTLSAGDKVGVQRAYGHVDDVVAMDVTRGDQVITWYADGTVSRGTNRDLGAVQASDRYTLPPGKATSMIRGIAMGPDNKARAYYSDGTMSRGTTRDLDAYEAPKPYTLAPGMTPDNIMDVGVSQYDVTYVWYRVGSLYSSIYNPSATYTVSSGTSTDLDSARAPRAFTVAPYRDAWSIIGIGIGPTDDVRVWHGDLTASRGNSADLDAYEGSFSYRFPDLCSPSGC